MSEGTTTITNYGYKHQKTKPLCIGSSTGTILFVEQLPTPMKFIGLKVTNSLNSRDCSGCRV